MSLQMLDYASRESFRARWGPFLVRPSRRTLLLVLLAGITFYWLARRHDPWEHVAAITPPASAFGAATVHFTPSNRLLLCGGSATIHDADSGVLLHTIAAPAPLPFTFPLAGGGEVAHVRDHTAHIHDTQTGRHLKAVPLPPIRGFRFPTGISAVSPIGRKLLTRSTLPEDRFAEVGYDCWDLDAPHAVDRPIDSVGMILVSDKARFSFDASRILAFPRDRTRRLADGPEMLLGVINAKTFRFVWDDQTVVTEVDRAVWSPDGRRIVVGYGDGPDLLAVRDAETGARLITIAAVSYNPADRYTPLIASDATRAVVIVSTARTPPMLRVFDLNNANELARSPRAVPAHLPPPTLFPNGRRLFEYTADSTRFALYDTAILRPVAFLRSPVSLYSPTIAADGRHLAAPGTDGKVHLFRKVGGECRESTLGVLGMPHAWLLIAMVTAAAFSLRADARAVVGPLRWLSVALLLAALPRTLHFVLAASLQQFLLTPAPLLALCAIALATGSRFWRFATLAALAGSLCANLYCLRQLQRAGLDLTIYFSLLDRTWELQAVVACAIFAFASALTLPALVLLARPSRAHVA